MTHAGINKKKILIIDDDREVSELVEITLKNEGYSVIRTNNGLTGLELARSQNPDLVVMDITMPIMSGIKAARKIIEQNKSSFIILLRSIQSHLC